MKFAKWFSISILVILLLLPWHQVLGQAGSGYAKIGVVAFGTNSYTDATVADGSVYMYQVTAENVAGESVPLTIGPAKIPATGTHSATLTWGQSQSGADNYYIYRFLVLPPSPPTSGAVVVN